MAGRGQAERASGRFDRVMQQAQRCLRKRHVCRRLARCWLERDERKVGAAAERPEERLLNTYVLLLVYVLMAVTGLGYLALTWSTVVLLGGFVTALGKKDFWCLTVISLVQAARIFDDLKDDLVPNLLSLTYRLLNHPHNGFSYEAVARSLLAASSERERSSFATRVSVGAYFYIILMIPVNVVVIVVSVLHQGGPFVCIVLSSWRLRWRDYGATNGDNGKANLMPALDIFYALILLQGVFYLFWFFNDTVGEEIVESVNKRCKICAKWGHTLVAEYLVDTRGKCAREPASIKGRNLISYAVGLVDSESQEGYLSGARMLDVLIRQGVDVRSLLLLSRPKIQKLIDTLGWRSRPSKKREIRELAARIVADLAGDIHLAQFPGAMLCIASLLETDQPYWNNKQAPHDEVDSSPIAVSRTDKLSVSMSQHGKEVGQKDKDGSIDDNGREGETCNELILQGLTILERLASNHHNCRDIGSTPGVILKITAPIYSDTLIQDIKINAWANVVSRSYKVLHRLIRAPGRTGRRLRRGISSNKQAVSNLEGILSQGREIGEDLKMQAIEILTELALDLSINLNRKTEEKLIEKQLQIFLLDEGQEEPAAMLNMLKTTAGRTLAVLSNKSEANCVFIIMKHNNIVDRLAIMLDAKTNIIYRAIAAEFLENLLTYDKDKLHTEHVTEALLPKMLTEVLSKGQQQTEASQQNISKLGAIEGVDEISARGADEENRFDKVGGQKKSSNRENSDQTVLKKLQEALIGLSSVVDKTMFGYRNAQCNSSSQGNADQTVTKELQEALLSLTLVMYDRIIGADRFAVVVQANSPGHGAFVAKLKTIVEENCQATPTSLRIIKLCVQIAISMMRRSQYAEHFKDPEFVELLSTASEIMSNLESCLLFAGTDCRAMKTARPLLSDLVSNFERELHKELDSFG